MDKKNDLIKSFVEATQSANPDITQSLHSNHGMVIFVIGDNNHIVHPTAPVLLISPKQCAWIKRLVRDIVKAERRSIATFNPAKVWTALNDHMDVTTYKDIPRANFDEAKDFLNNWLNPAKQL